MTTPRKPAAKTAVTKTTIPAGAKVPDDRKPKDDGKTHLSWKGRNWAVDDTAFDDMDFLEAAEKMQYVACAIFMLGEEQYQQFKEHMRDPETGKSKASELIKFVETASEKFRAKN